MVLPSFRKILFWDTNPAEIDWERHCRAVISRVMHRGNLQEWKAFKEFYGEERIKNEIPHINWQDPKTEHFFKWLYNYNK